MLFQIKTINGQKTIVPLTADTGTGAPVGSLISMYKKSSPSGYLYCDGSTFDETKYPALYQYLGSNVLPDYREFALVGAEENTTDVYNASTNPTGTIHDHDVYTEGQAKDDQMEILKLVALGDLSATGTFPTLCSVSNSVGNAFPIGEDRTTSRVGTVTRGKRKAVYFYIKATSGLTENQQENVLNTINENNSYSTEEHKTGKKWIDGKDIYSKTFVFENINLTSSPQVIGNLGNINVANITKKETVVKNITNGIFVSDNQGFVYIGNGSDIIGVQTITSATSGWYVYYTLEYTKAS